MLRHLASYRYLILFLLLIGIFATNVVFPQLLLAQVEQPEPITIYPVIGFDRLDQAINTLFTAALFFGALLTFGYLVYGAIQYLTAKDNSNQVTAARQTMQNAIIGLFLLAAVYLIFQFVINLIPGLGNFFTF